MNLQNIFNTNKLKKNMTARKIFLKLLKMTAFNITIKHHYTHEKFNLNTYKHKGYWFHGKNREVNTIKMFYNWIKPDQFILEIGGHIGYFSTLYAHLVGTKGKVTGFEPSTNNLLYLEKNISSLKKNNLKDIVTIEKKGVGNTDGYLDFYIDPITGQNNSFVENFEGFNANKELSAEPNAQMVKERVEIVKLDTYFKNTSQFPDFVKIDVEGFEWPVIQGFKTIIEATKPSFMIEIQADADKIIDFFLEQGYKIYNDTNEEIISYKDYLSKFTANIFFKYDC